MEEILYGATNQKSFSSAVISNGTIHLVCNSNFRVCGENAMVWPFKLNIEVENFGFSKQKKQIKKRKEKKRIKPGFLGSFFNPGYLFLWVKGLTPTLRQNHWPEFPKKVLMIHRANTRLETITHAWCMHKDVAFVKENWFFFHFMNAQSAYTVIKRKEDKTYLVNSASKSSSSTARS